MGILCASFGHPSGILGALLVSPWWVLRGVLWPSFGGPWGVLWTFLEHPFWASSGRTFGVLGVSFFGRPLGILRVSLGRVQVIFVGFLGSPWGVLGVSFRRPWSVLLRLPRGFLKASLVCLGDVLGVSLGRPFRASLGVLGASLGPPLGIFGASLGCSFSVLGAS